LLPFTLREGFMTYARLLANNNLPNWCGRYSRRTADMFNLLKRSGEPLVTSLGRENKRKSAKDFVGSKPEQTHL
jgi:hypothetical protein